MKLYVIKDSARSEYKIGIAKSAMDRLAALQIGCPSKLELVLEIPIPYDVGAGKIERKIHKQFRGKHIHGEWFKLLDEEIVTIPYLVHDFSILGRRGKLPDNWRKFAACLRHSVVDCGWCRMDS